MRPLPRTLSRNALLVLALLLTGFEAAAADTWTAPFAGVRRLHRTNAAPRWNINVVEVDLAAPGVSLRSTAHAERGRTVSSFANLTGAQVVINGDFYVAGHATLGLSAGLSMQWPNNSDKNNTGNLAFGTGRVDLFHPTAITTFDPTWMKGVVSGLMAVVWDGTVFPVASDPLCSARHPRTSVGLSADKKKLYLAVVDGRNAALSIGMTCGELGTLMKDVGAHYAINLDGGGSATMFLRGAGVVNRPSDGSERVVANHLAIHASPPSTTGVLKGIIYEAPDTTKRISGATVRLSDGSTTVTSVTGLYTFTVPPGAYTATASKPGFIEAAKGQTVTANLETWNSIGLTRAPVADTDGDGVADTTDNCVERANVDQADLDADGVGDACDPDKDGNGLPDELPVTEPPADAGQTQPIEPVVPPGPGEMLGSSEPPLAQGPSTEGSGVAAEESDGIAKAGCGATGTAGLLLPLGLLAGLLPLRRRRKAKRAAPDAR